jgi:hypothetical protein
VVPARDHLLLADDDDLLAFVGCHVTVGSVVNGVSATT